MTLELRPVSFSDATNFIADYHRHHVPSRGWKFGVAVYNDSDMVGVATCGRPVARMLNAEWWTLEVNRVCVFEGAENACSMLYSACWRAARALGYHRLITYILPTEPGTSLKAAGWVYTGDTGHENSGWQRPDRPLSTNTMNQGNKHRWEIRDSKDEILRKKL